MTGFFFNNRHSREFWMAMEDAQRPLLPALRRNDYEITGRHGTVDFGGETYATRQIQIDICFISDNIYNLQAVARDIAFWLSGKGLLWFDDEPDKAFDAVIYESVDTDQLIRTKRSSVVFECQPFAKTINYLQSVHSGASSGHVVDIYSDGTVPTPVIIIIKNTGGLDIENIAIRRRAITQ